ncbi:tyrosine-type recombinase/integrase [Candidatus Poribacteria bacterium]|nr:tyrosine-type recombinase/integrase [Candidatus Poribacteria bacterium]
MPNIYQRKNKRTAKWSVYVVFPNGQRFRRTVGTKKEAERVQRKLEAEIVEGKWELWLKEDITFSDLVEGYLEYSSTTKARSTSRGDKCRINKHLLPHFGKIPLSQITPQMLENYKQKRVKEGAAPVTVNHDLSNLSHMFKMAIRWGYIDKNAASSVERMKVTKNLPRFLNQEEIQRLIEAAEGSYIHPLIVTALHTGMRKGELFNLKWMDIDFDRRTVTIQSKSDWHTKNYKSRMIQLTPVLYNILREHRERSGLSEYVFTYCGKKLKSNIKRTWSGVLGKAGLERVTLHTLRHTFASHLVMAGVALREVQELMGHQSYETTLLYAHVAEEHSKKKVLQLPYAGG